MAHTSRIRKKTTRVSKDELDAWARKEYKKKVDQMIRNADSKRVEQGKIAYFNKGLKTKLGRCIGVMPLEDWVRINTQYGEGATCNEEMLRDYHKFIGILQPNT